MCSTVSRISRANWDSSSRCRRRSSDASSTTSRRSTRHCELPPRRGAAERIADTGELLRRGRWERAFENAQQAIADDPNNPAGFRAAAWALLGLQRGPEAQQHFLECADAADGDDRAQALRQAARLALALDDENAALRILASVDDRTSAFEQRAVAYDRGIYLAGAGRDDEARAAIERAFEDERFALWAFADPLLTEHPQLAEIAAGRVRALTQELASLRAQLDRLIAAAAERLDAQETQSAPGWSAEPHAEFTRRMEALHADLESARARHEGGLSALRDELATTLLPAARALAEEIDVWHAELEAQQAQTEALRTRAEALQAIVSDAAERLARDKHGEVRRDAVCITVGPGVEVYSAIVTRKMRPFRPGKTWLVTLDDNERLVVTKTLYHY